MGGGEVINEGVAAGLIDTLSVHLAPIVLGEGTPLFSGGTKCTLVQRSAIQTANATHLLYEVA